ncbi:MAG: transcription factor [Nitrososphaerota archaeon]|nr:transcription factor [Nitrososphaerota archaeon]
MMERMGLNMKQVEDVKEVVIITGSKEMRLPQAQVFEINAKGMRVFQVSSSTVEEKEVEAPKAKEEDIALVASQAGVSRERAKAALEEADGDIALAILRLSS